MTAWWCGSARLTIVVDKAGVRAAKLMRSTEHSPVGDACGQGSQPGADRLHVGVLPRLFLARLLLCTSRKHMAAAAGRASCGRPARSPPVVRWPLSMWTNVRLMVVRPFSGLFQ